MADLNEDVVEQILIELDVKDLIRFKTVCKSWHSLITSPGFVTRHLNRSYNKDRYNNELGHRRITLFDDLTSGYDLVGSSNGLVCLISNSPYIIPSVFVGNPLTREVRQLRSPPHSIGSLLCWGFGYDIFKDDYTVFVGAKKGNYYTIDDVWLMKSYNVKESWEHLSCDHDMKYDIVHGLSDNFSHLPDQPRLNKTLGDINSPVFVQSLVSPRVNVRPMGNKRSVEVGSIYYVFLSFIHMTFIHFSS
ncbi:putative F-box domain-containing protein [Helianthus annuus]|nr:putative F-box domain-containing protein [Helianthus annuus]KAJ0941566.1 putative F-box domain-containing protein [Helianthus annuus]